MNNTDLVPSGHGTARVVDQMQIRRFCLRQQIVIADVRTSTWVGIQSASVVAH